MSKTTREPIPESVLALLRHKWPLPDGYWAFESVFRGDGDDEEYRSVRQRRPAYYFIEKGRDRETEFDLFSHIEALGLIRDRVFGAVAEDQGSHVCINEHAAHALEDFCTEVYGAWAKYLERLQEAARACPRPGANEGDRR